MNIYKLKFSTNEEAESIFLALGLKAIINYEGVDYSIYINGTKEIVNITSDEILYDVMTSDTIDFGVNEIFPVTETHSFYV